MQLPFILHFCKKLSCRFSLSDFCNKNKNKKFKENPINNNRMNCECFEMNITGGAYLMRRLRTCSS